MAGTIIQVEEVTFTYPDGTRALNEISLEIKAGEKIAVLGANGSGKTSLFLCFNGILKPQRGKIFYRGKPLLYDRRSLQVLRSKLGIVFQDPDIQLFSASVLQEIAFGPLNLGLSQEDVLARVETAMNVTGISDLMEKSTHLLSYGQKKRVSIADILAMEPEVVISDEPTAWLDQEHSEKIMNLFNEINNRGTTVIISTHDSDLAYSWANKVIILQEGKVLTKGDPAEVFGIENVLAKAGIKKPFLLEVFSRLQKKGFLIEEKVPPKTIGELEEMLPQFSAKFI
ncbi:MAG: ATP-binding cassette domain-containing protein [Dethiobacter sp.]|nr:MAG: ATP-binding cassette domain-containing protein [Dethiobacter sp.]